MNIKPNTNPQLQIDFLLRSYAKLFQYRYLRFINFKVI